MASYTPHWLAVILARDGVGQDFTLKCVQYEDGAVYWEMRLIFAAMLPRRQKIQTWALLKTERGLWEKSFSEFGLSLDDELAASMRAAQLRSRDHGDAESSERCRQEFTLSTRGLMAVLLTWITMRHIRADRDRAKSILGGIISRLGTGAVRDTTWLPEWLNAGGGLCGDKVDESGMCQHMQAASSSFDRFRADPTPDNLTEGLRNFETLLVFGNKWCGSTQACRARLPTVLADLCDVEVDGLARTDPTQERTPTLGCKRKRPRIDEDVKRAATMTVAKAGRASSGAAWARATQQVHEKCLPRWEHDEMRSYMVAASCLLQDGPTVFSVVEDASRIGDPAEDTMVYLCWSGKHDTGLYLPIQVLPEWRGFVQKKATNTEKVEHMQAWAKKMRSFMGMHESKTMDKKQSLKSKKLANIYHMSALDHSLQCVGMSLATFVSTVPLCDESKGEERYFVPVDSLPENIRQRSPGRVVRSCVRSADGRRRLECHWGAKRSVLMNYLDQGSVGWMSKYYLWQVQKIRGAYFPDPCHRHHNNYLLCMSEERLNLSKYEVLMAMNLTSGPWQKHGFFHQFTEAATEYWSATDASDPLFQQLYEALCEDYYNGALPADYGSIEHQKQFREMLSGAEFYQRRDHKVKLGVWFSVVRRAVAFQQWWTPMLLILVYIGVHDGWASSLKSLLPKGSGTETSSGSRALSVAAAAAASSSSGGAREAEPSNSRSVDGGKADMNKVRQKHENSMHCVASILANRTTRRVTIIWSTIGNLLGKLHGDMITQLQTQGGNLCWYSSMADGAWSKDLKQFVDIWGDREFLLSLRLLQDDRLQYHKLPPLPEEEVQALAALMVSFSGRMLAKHIAYMRWYSECFPGKLLALASDDKEIQERALSWCQEAWLVLHSALEAAKTRAWLNEVIDQLMWPKSVWVMETLIGLREADFRSVPPDLLEELRLAARSQGMSKSAEDMFGHLKACMKQHPSGRLGRMARWHRASCSGILENMDRKELRVDDSAVEQSKSMPKLGREIFAATAGDFSLGEKAKQEFLKNNFWQSPSQLHFFQVPMAWSCLVQNQDNFDNVRKEWLALLVVPNTVLFKNGGKRAWWVLSSCEYGVLACPVRPIERGSLWVARFGSAGDFWEQLSIQDENEWAATDIICSAPELVGRTLREQGLPAEDSLGNKVCLTVENKRPQDLALFAARKAFVGTTVPFLKKLWYHWELDTPPPSHQADLLQGLIKHKLPELSDDEVRAIIATRTARPPSSFESDLQLEDLDDAAQLVDDEDRAVMKTQVLKAKADTADSVACKAARVDLGQVQRAAEGAKAAPAKPPAQAVVEAKARVADEPPGRVLKRIPRDGDGDISLAKAREYMPQGVKGCSLHKDVVLHHRWVAKYPTPEPPHSNTKAWNAEVSSHQALQSVLKWVWAQHTAQTGQRCPWKLDAGTS